MTGKLLAAGVCLENWAPGVPFPPADVQGTVKKQGVKELGLPSARTLAEGLVYTCAKFVDRKGRICDHHFVDQSLNQLSSFKAR